MMFLEPEAAPVLQPVTDIYNGLATWITNLFGSHPWLFAVIAILVSVNNAARLKEKRAIKAGTVPPEWAVTVIGLTDPLVLNFWRILDWLADKFGLPVHGPTDSGETPLPKEKP